MGEALPVPVKDDDGLNVPHTGRCRVCRFVVDTDDCEIAFDAGDVLCTRCYHRLCGHDERLHRTIIRDVNEAAGP